jgi:hypothetical protein
MAESTPSRFSIRPAKIGDGYLVVYSPEGSPQMEIRQTFVTEREAQKWINSESETWLERLGAGR